MKDNKQRKPGRIQRIALAGLTSLVLNGCGETLQLCDYKDPYEGIPSKTLLTVSFQSMDEIHNQYVDFYGDGTLDIFEHDVYTREGHNVHIPTRIISDTILAIHYSNRNRVLMRDNPEARDLQSKFNDFSNQCEFEKALRNKNRNWFYRLFHPSNTKI